MAACQMETPRVDMGRILCDLDRDVLDPKVTLTLTWVTLTSWPPFRIQRFYVWPWHLTYDLDIQSRPS